MKPGRNDPCPCGSGRKYKQCCARADAAAEPILRILGRESRSENDNVIAHAIARPTAWEADVVPMPMAIDTEPDALPVAVVLAAGDVVLSADIQSRPPADAEGVAQLLATAIRNALARGGAPPSLVRVAHPEVATRLHRMLNDLGVPRVVAEPVLPMIVEFAGGLRQHLTGSAIPVPAISSPMTWAAWNLPTDVVATLFSSAATYYSRAPWANLADADILELTMPSGHRWFACILGNAGEQFGLVLYELLEDYLALVEADDPSFAFASSRGIVISLSFDTRSELSKPMRKEIDLARWPIAGPLAYPTLWTLNTIGGGLSEEYAHDLVMALDVVGLFALQQALPPGTTVRFALDEPLLWDQPLRLDPSLPQGKRADVTAFSGYDDTDSDSSEDRAILERFALYNRAMRNEVRALRDLHNASLFVGIMHGHQGVRLPAVTEFDLRVFLYELLPAKAAISKAKANEVRMSLKRFFEFLAEKEQIHYPWAAAILRDKFGFEVRWDTVPDEQWAAELYADLNARVMLPVRDLADLGEWGPLMDEREARLSAELQRQWLIWRDEEIGLGNTSPDDLREQLSRRQAAWETSPNAKLRGSTPSKIIARERSGRR